MFPSRFTITRPVKNRESDTIESQRENGGVRYAFFRSGKGIKIRHGRWGEADGHPRGSVVMLGGRKEFLEKYAETAANLNQRGFVAYGFDWRGQGLSTRMLPDRLKGFVRDYREYLGDLQAFMEKQVFQARARPLYLLAHSMGAHIALRWLHRQPQSVDGAILIAPMLDLHTTPYPKWLLNGLTRLVLKAGLGTVLVPGSRKRTGHDRPFDGNPLTSDPVRFQVEKKAIAANPDLALGGVTFAWLAATLESIKCLKGSGYLEKISTPMLMVVAGKDRVVSTTAQGVACSRLPACSLMVIPEARHEILQENDAVQAHFWRAFDNFVKSRQV